MRDGTAAKASRGHANTVLGRRSELQAQSVATPLGAEAASRSLGVAWVATRSGVRPVDRLFATYAAVAGLALAFPARPASWPLLALLHLLAMVLALRPGPVGRALDALARANPAAARTLRAWYPLLLIPALYAELAPLNVAVHAGAYFDAWVIAWEEAFFGGQPSRSWAVAAPYLLLSESLHAAYLSYYLIIFGPPLMLYVQGRTEAFERVVFTIMLTFFLHYIFFIYLPVQGPRYLFPPPEGPLADGLVFQVTHRVLEGGSSQGAAFPSSHVGVAVAQTALAARLLRPLFPILVILTIGLAVGAVYGGFHYGIDAIAGLVLGLVSFGLAPTLARRLGPGRTGSP